MVNDKTDDADSLKKSKSIINKKPSELNPVEVSRAALKKQYKKYKARISKVIKGLIIITTLAVVALFAWIFITQLTLTPSERVAEAFRDTARLEAYEVEFTITGSSGDDSSTLTGLAMIDDDLSLTTHSADINDELTFAFDVFRNNSEDIEEQQTLTRYTNTDIFIAQLGLDDQQLSEADFDELVNVWVESGGQVPFIDVADTIDSVNLSDAQWENNIIKAEQTNKTRQYARRNTTGYEITVDTEQVESNLDQLSGDGKDELLRAYGVPAEFDITDEQFSQFLEQVKDSYERINESNLTAWLDGSRLIAVTSEDVVVQNSQFDKIELIYTDKGASVTVEKVSEDEIISQQKFIERLNKLQSEPSQ